MTQNAVREAAARAKIEIDNQIDQFIDKLDRASKHPEDFITMSQLESEWRQLSQATHKTYSDLVSKALSTLDTKELESTKKVNSSRKESG